MNDQNKYRPLPSFLSIGPSNIEGAGIIAQDDIPKDVVIGITQLIDEDDYKKLKTIKKIEMGKELTITYDFKNFYKP